MKVLVIDGKSYLPQVNLKFLQSGVVQDVCRPDGSHPEELILGGNTFREIRVGDLLVAVTATPNVLDTTAYRVRDISDTDLCLDVGYRLSGDPNLDSAIPEKVREQMQKLLLAVN